MTTILDQYKRQDTRLMVVAIAASVALHGIILYLNDTQWDFSVNANDKYNQRIALSFVKNEPEDIASSSVIPTETNQPQNNNKRKDQQHPSDIKQRHQVPVKKKVAISRTRNGISAGINTKMLPVSTTALLTQKPYTVANTDTNNKPLDWNKNQTTEKTTSNQVKTNVAKMQSNNPDVSLTTDAKEYQEQVLHQINDELRKHIKYPFLARKRGWSGKVTISFEFTERGTIHNINLSRSSGYPLLDKSALNAFHSIMHIRFINPYNAAQSDTLQLPVEYRLTEG